MGFLRSAVRTLRERVRRRGTVAASADDGSTGHDPAREERVEQTVKAASLERRKRGRRHRGGAAPALRSDRLGYAESGFDGECVLVIGFDFGTSTSKIVVHAPFLPGAPRFLARREGRTGGDRDWLWPSSFTEDSTGICGLNENDDGLLHCGIKLNLMEAASADSDAKNGTGAMQAVAVYIGLVLRSVREQVLKTHAGVLRTFSTLDWSLNVGIPAGWTRDADPRGIVESGLEDSFRSAVEAGWRLSLRDTPFRLKDAEEALQCDESGEIEIGLVPEVIAGALGYAQSGERRDGLHLMMDVGAGTVDACLFRLRMKDGVEHWPLLEARVERLGTAELHDRRVAGVRRVDEKAAERLRRSYDPFDGNAASPTTPCPRNPARSAVVEADEAMTEEVQSLAGHFVQEARTRRDPHAAEFKAAGRLPVLLMGGGSRAALYDEALRRLDVVLRRHLPTGQLGAQILDAPVPRALNLETQGLGFRLAVAVGLSVPEINLPDHTAPSEIADIPMSVPERSRPDSVDKDQV